MTELEVGLKRLWLVRIDEIAQSFQEEGEEPARRSRYRLRIARGEEGRERGVLAGGDGLSGGKGQRTE